MANTDPDPDPDPNPDRGETAQDRRSTAQDRRDDRAATSRARQMRAQEETADELGIDRDQVITRDRREGTDVRLTREGRREAIERMAEEEIEDIRGELADPDDIFVPIDDPRAAGLLGRYRSELASGSISGASEVETVIYGSDRESYADSPVEAIEETDPEWFDEFWRDRIVAPAEEYQEQALEAIDERRELYEEDPVEFLESIQEESDQFGRMATPLSASWRVGTGRRSAARDQAEEIAQNIASQDDALDPGDLDVDVDPTGRDAPDIGLESDAQERLAEQQAGSIADATGAPVQSSDIDVGFRDGGIQTQVDEDAVQARQLEQQRQQRAQDFGVEPDDLERQETDDGVAFRPDGVSVDPEQMDQDFLEEVLSEEEEEEEEIDPDAIDTIEFEDDGVGVEYDQDWLEERAEEQAAAELGVSTEAIEAEATGDDFDFEVVEGQEEEFLTREVSGDDAIARQQRLETGTAPDVPSVEQDLTGQFDVDDFDVGFDDGQLEMGVDTEAQERVAREQLSDDLGVEPDEIGLERDGDQFTVDDETLEEFSDDEEEIDSPERETRVGSWLQRRSDSWQESARGAGDWIEERTPETGGMTAPVLGPTAVAQDSTPEQVDVDTEPGEALSTTVEWPARSLDLPGAVLGIGDLGQFAFDEARGVSEARRDAAQELIGMDFDEIQEEPEEAGLLALESQVPVDHISGRVEAGAGAAVATADAGVDVFTDDPLSATMGGSATVLTAFAAPSAVMRGGRAVRSRAPTEGRLRGSDGLGMGERGQMEMTIQRQRDLPDEAYDPADPTAPTPEGRAPPRDMLTEEQWTQAVRRRQEEISREQVDQPSPQIDSSATPVERVREQRELFDDWGEYQRELQQARELGRQQQSQQSGGMSGAFGDPSQLEATTADGDPDTLLEIDAATASPGGRETTTSTVDTDPDTDQQLDFAFGDPTAGETTTEAGFDSDLDMDISASFADPTQDQQVTAAEETMMDTSLDQALAQDFATDTSTITGMDTALDQPMAMDQPTMTGQQTVTDQSITMAMDQPMQTTVQQTRSPPRTPRQPPWPDDDDAFEGFGGAAFSEDDDIFETGIADAEEAFGNADMSWR